MEPYRIHVLLGSTRTGRYGDKPAHWLLGRLHRNPAVAAELLDLRDWPLPFFDDPTAPAMADGKYAQPAAQRWAAKIAEADAYIVIVAEYNHGYTAVLKNAFDWIYQEWNNKPIAYVGYGNAGGARAIEQLRAVAVELEMAPIRRAVSISSTIYNATVKEQAPARPELFEPLDKSADAMIDQLLWWAKALKTARQAG